MGNTPGAMLEPPRRNRINQGLTRNKNRSIHRTPSDRRSKDIILDIRNHIDDDETAIVEAARLGMADVVKAMLQV